MSNHDSFSINNANNGLKSVRFGNIVSARGHLNKAVRVSVCMASYNGERFVRQQVDSIMEQLGPNDELVISDDSSSDKTLTILRDVADPRIRIIDGGRFRTPVRNFEFCLAHAAGRFVFLSDQDDVWKPGKVTEVVELLEHFDLVQTDAELIDENGSILAPSVLARTTSACILRTLARNPYFGNSMAFRRSVLTWVLPIPLGVPMHDWWIGLTVESFGRVHFYPKPLTQWRRHDGNTSPMGRPSPYSLKTRVYWRACVFIELIRRWFRIRMSNASTSSVI